MSTTRHHFVVISEVRFNPYSLSRDCQEMSLENNDTFHEAARLSFKKGPQGFAEHPSENYSTLPLPLCTVVA